MGRRFWTRRDILRGGGYGDRILATTNDPAAGWYWREVCEERGYFNDEFRPKRGVVKIDRAVQSQLRQLVPPDALLIEPHYKGTFSADNKDWGFERWDALARDLGRPLVQCRYGDKRVLGSVQTVHTPSFKMAYHVLSVCRGLICSQGGLQYAAAALHLPAVIVYGSFSEARVLGYDDQVAVEEKDPEGVGWRVSHPACRAAMERISVERVRDAVHCAFSGASLRARAG